MQITELLARLKTMEQEQRENIKHDFEEARTRAEKNARALRLAQQIIDTSAIPALLDLAAPIIVPEVPSTPPTDVAILRERPLWPPAARAPGFSNDF
jgi:hypothetical protein